MTFSRCISGTTLSNIHAWKLVHIMTVCVYICTHTLHFSMLIFFNFFPKMSHNPTQDFFPLSRQPAFLLSLLGGHYFLFMSNRHQSAPLRTFLLLSSNYRCPQTSLPDKSQTQKVIRTLLLYPNGSSPLQTVGLLRGRGSLPPSSQHSPWHAVDTGPINHPEVPKPILSHTAQLAPLRSPQAPISSFPAYFLN